MRYMMLIHHDDAALGAADQRQLWADYAAFNDALAKADGAQPGERLQPPAGATTVRVAGGRKTVVDGPYSDTKEQLAGYFIIDVPDLAAAVEWAERCPSSRYGAIEIRPIMSPAGA